MASPPQDAIQMFMSITGASEAVALQKLEEHHGELNAAVNAHFNEGDRIDTNDMSGPTAHNDLMDIDGPIDVESSGPTHPLMFVPQNLNPFALLNSNFGRSFLNGDEATVFPSGAPRVSHPREVREIPIEVKDEDTRPESSGRVPIIEDITDKAPSHGPLIHGNVVIDDDEGDLPSAPPYHGTDGSRDASYGRRPGPSAPLVDVTDHNNDIEEEMIKAAIEASRREVAGYPDQQFPTPNDLTNPQGGQGSPALEDVEFERAVSLSLKTAEKEKALRELGVYIGEQSNSSGMNVEEAGKVTSPNGRQLPNQLREEGSANLQEEVEEVEEPPLIRHRSRRHAGTAESGQVADIPPLSPQRNDIDYRPRPNGDSIHRDEWGGMSSEEHDEAVMLEAAMFGGIPEGAAYRFAYSPHRVLQTDSDSSSSLYPRIPRPASPTLTAQRLLREQQDDEYLAALQADREKELKAKQEAEAALEREKHQEEEIRRKQLEEEEFERKLAAKEASLPPEPSADDESAVTLLVRMPDGSRHGRRFLKSNRLQLLFDFIDVGRVVKPGTYRLVRPYPRRAFTDTECELSLSELGLTSKQEALFLELI